MGAWSASVTGNDNVQDFKQEYAAAFYKYDVQKALELLNERLRPQGEYAEEDELRRRHELTSVRR